MRPHLTSLICTHGSADCLFCGVGLGEEEDALSYDSLWRLEHDALEAEPLGEIWCVWGFSHPVTSSLGVIHS